MALFTGSPLAVTFGILGNIISLFVYFAPLPTFYRIYRKKSTEDFQSLPYLVALFSAMLWFYYALLKPDAFLLITINSFGCFIESIYIIMYIIYAPRASRSFTLKLFIFMNMVVFSLIVLLTHFVLNGPLRTQVVGWICVAFSVSVFAAPLSIVARVVRTKSVEFMPFTLSFFLTLSAIIWFAYGVFQKDKCIALPNILGFLLGFVQMVLYGFYRNAEKGLEEIKLPEHTKSVVILSPLSASDIYPVEVQLYYNGDDENDDRKQTPEPQKIEKSIQVSTCLKPDECPV